MMTDWILGTAGHIDHGKTALVERLTGVNTDRLKEEQRRGMTIDIGFAHFVLPSGATVGIVDVPGHEQFIRNMVAGVTGIDAAMLIVAADDGVMPQTREHLDILRFLNIHHGFVAITKIDLVDEELLELVKEDVEDLIKGTFLEGSEFVETSAKTGVGIENIVARMEMIGSRLRHANDRRPFRMHIDRVFSPRGLGCIVTGSAVSGVLRQGEKVDILPINRKARVRNIQCYGMDTPEAHRGERVAIHLADVSAHDLARGLAICAEDSFSSGHLFMAQIQVSPSYKRGLRHGEMVRIHHGTQESLGRVLLDVGGVIEAGEKRISAIRLRTPISGAYHDPFVMRSLSPQDTIAGGRLVWPIIGQKWRKHSMEFWMSVANARDGYEAAEKCIDEDPRGLSLADIARWLGETQTSVLRGMDTEIRSGCITVIDVKGTRQLIAVQYLSTILTRIANVVREYHREHPESEGIELSKLREACDGGIADEIWKWCLSHFRQVGIECVGKRVRDMKHQSQLSDSVQKEAASIYKEITERGFSPPKRSEICDSPSRDVAFKWLCENSRLVHIAGELWLTDRLRDRLIDVVRECLEKKQSATAAELKKALGTTRKYAIAMLEYLDEQRVTVRRGDVRILLSPKRKKVDSEE